MTELIIASKNGYYNKVTELLTKGYPVKSRDRDNATALYWGACRGHARICVALVEAGSDINARVKWGSTALHACSDRGHLDCVKLLIDFGAQLNIQNVRGDTPLHLAGYRGYADIVNVLLEARANVVLLNEKKKTAEQEARGQGHIRVANILQSYAQEHQVSNTERDVTAPTANVDHSSEQHRNRNNLVTENKENQNFQWNDFDEYRGSESCLKKEWSPSVIDSGSQPLQRSPMEPQESEEPCSASSWDGASPVDTPPSILEGFSMLNNNSNFSHSDVYAEKKVKRPVSISGYPFNTASSAAHIPKDSGWLQSSARQSHGAATTLAHNVFHPKWHQPAPLNRDGDVSKNISEKPPSSTHGHSQLAKQTSHISGNKPPQELQKRLEEVSRYAENLQLKLVNSLETISQLEKVNLEKQTLLEHYVSLQNKTKEDTQKEIRNQELGEEVKRLRDQLQLLQAECDKNTDSNNGADRTDPSGFLRSREPSLSPTATVNVPSEMEAAMDTSSAVHPSNNNSRSGSVVQPCNSANLQPPNTTHTNILHALKVCVGDKVLSDHHIHILNQRYKNQLRAKWTRDGQQRQLLDQTNREWSPGRDFKLLDKKPLNQNEDGHREGSCSLIFRISHREKIYILKMMINLIDMASSGHGNGQSLPKFLRQSFGAEYDIPLRLPPHDNLVQICHFYEGSTRGFRHFLPYLVPTSLDVPLDMANRTAFMVFPAYPLTLKDFMLDFRTKNPLPPFGLSGEFLLLLLYQLLSAVDHLVKNGVVHRDIKADNIFLDQRLRPVIGDFGFARRFQDHGGQRLMFTDSEQVFAGNSNAWAPELARLNRNGPQSLPAMASLEEIYQKADAYAVSRMFHSLLRPLEEADEFPFSSMSVPHYEEADIPQLHPSLSPGLEYVLHQLVLDHPEDRPTAHQAMVLVGMMLAGPVAGEVNTAGEFMTFYQAKLLQHLASASQKRCCETQEVVSLETSVLQNSPDMEIHLLTHATPQELWDSCKLLKQISLTRS